MSPNHEPGSRGAGYGDPDFQRRVAELDRANAAHRSRRYPSLLLRWLSTALGRPRRIDVPPLPRVLPSQISLTFVGHASVLIRYAGLTLLTDPMLGNRLGRLGLIRRELEPGLADGDLQGVDVVIVSNSDPAHLHVPSLQRIPRSATIVVPPACAGRLGHLGFHRLVELAPDQELGARGVSIHTTALAPSGGLGFVIRGDGPTLFFAGRCGYGPLFRDIGRVHHPDLALLPIGGYLPASFRRRHLSPLDALYAFEDLRARLLVPIHFGSFVLSYERLGEPPRWLADLVSERKLDDYVVPLAPGERRLFTNPARTRRPTPHAHLDASKLILTASAAFERPRTPATD